MNKVIIMEQTFNILSKETKKESLEKGTIKELKSETETIKYLIIEE